MNEYSVTIENDVPPPTGVKNRWLEIRKMFESLRDGQSILIRPLDSAKVNTIKNFHQNVRANVMKYYVGCYVSRVDDGGVRIWKINKAKNTEKSR